MVAVSCVLQGFRPGRAQPWGCGPTGISLEEILSKAGPSHSSLSPRCTTTLLGQISEGCGNHPTPPPARLRILIQLEINQFSLARLFFNWVCSPIQVIGWLHEPLYYHHGRGVVWGSPGSAAGTSRLATDCHRSRHLMRQNTISPPFLMVTELHLVPEVK